MTLVYCVAIRSDGFLRSDEGDIACALLNAFEKRNQNDLKEVLKRQQLGFLDNEVSPYAFIPLA